MHNWAKQKKEQGWACGLTIAVFKCKPAETICFHPDELIGKAEKLL